MAKLFFYYSAMNAGKTTTLLQSAHNYHERGMRTLILTPRLDDRAGVGKVQSRIGLSAQGRIFQADDDLHALVAADKHFEYLAYPNRTHSIGERSGTRKHLYGSLADFLNRRVAPGPK